MTTNRIRLLRGRQPLLSEGAAWWLEHAQPLGIAQAEAIGFADPVRAAWAASNLHYVRTTTTGMTRARLREMGYGPRIDAAIKSGAPPDDWRR